MATNNTKKALSAVRTAKYEPKAAIGTGLYLPNHSGNLDAGNILKEPINDTDIINKKYLDDNYSFHEDGTSVGQLNYWNGSKWVHTETSELVWDDTNKRLGINTSSPEVALHIVAQAEVGGEDLIKLEVSDSSNYLSIFNNSATANQFLPSIYSIQEDRSNIEAFQFIGDVGSQDSGTVPAIRFQARAGIGATSNRGVFRIMNFADELMRMDKDGNLGINTTTPDTKLQVVGDCKFGDDNTNYIETSTTGDMIFVGGAGLCFGEIKAEGNTTETTISTAGTPVQVTIFDTNGESNNTTPDHTNDHITITKAGVYDIKVSATINSVAGVGSRLEITCKKNNGASEIIAHMDRNLTGGGGESGVISMSGLASLSVNDTIEIWIENETNTQNYIIEDISLSVIQIGG